MEGNELMVQQQAPPPMSIDDMKRQAKNMLALMKEVMRDGVDYGKIPGCPKPSLWQPGAEKTCLYFGVYVDVCPTEFFDPARSRTAKIEEKKWDNNLKKKVGTGKFREIECVGYYEVTTTAYLKRKADGSVVAVASATCNNFEKKYVEQDVYDIKNTIMAMSQKRAYVRVVRNGTAASDVFTDPDIPEGLWDTEGEESKPRESAVKEKPAGATKPAETPKQDAGQTAQEKLVALLLDNPHTGGDEGKADAMLKAFSTFNGKFLTLDRLRKGDEKDARWSGMTKQKVELFINEGTLPEGVTWPPAAE